MRIRALHNTDRVLNSGSAICLSESHCQQLNFVGACHSCADDVFQLPQSVNAMLLPGSAPTRSFLLTTDSEGVKHIQF